MEVPGPDSRTVEAASDLSMGLVASDRFELKRELGVGGFGRVFEAWDKEHAQHVALKLLHRKDPVALRRFKTEFRSLANLVHRNLVGLFELHQPSAETMAWFFTMELVDGRPFSEWLRPEPIAGASKNPSLVLTRPARPGVGPRRIVMPDVHEVSPALVAALEGMDQTLDPEEAGSFAVPERALVPGTPRPGPSATPRPDSSDDDQFGPRVGLGDATPDEAIAVAGAAVGADGHHVQHVHRGGARVDGVDRKGAIVPSATHSSAPHATPLALPQPFFGIEAPDAFALACWEATRPPPGSGVPLASVAPDRTFPEQRLKDSFRQLVEALTWLHASGHLHRDVKPSNVLIDNHGIVKVLDFGLVTRLFSTGPDNADHLIGTPAFMAPELCAGLPASPASDWYSVGVMLYLALTGSLPFEGDLATLVLAKQGVKPRSPSELTPVPRHLEEVCLALLSINPTERPDASALLDAFGAVGERGATNMWSPPRATTFVGRRAEVGALAASLAPPAGEDGPTGSRVVLVSGPSGLGKTSLVEHVLRELPSQTGQTGQTGRRPLVLRSRCFERGSVRYRALDGAIDDLSSMLASLTKAERAAIVPADLDVSALGRLFPVLAFESHRDSEATRSAEPADIKRRAFVALRELFLAVCRHRHVIVSIDDAHWADEDSVGPLAELVRHGCACWVLSFRDEERAQSPFLRALFDEVLPRLDPSSVTTLPLSPLTNVEAQALAREELSAAALLDPALAERVAKEAGGHPLLIAELAHATAHHTPGESRLTSHAGATEVLALDALLAARVAALPSSTRTVLELVAVAGEPVHTRLIRAATGADQRDLNQLYQEHLAQPRASQAGELVMCWHDRVRETTLASLGHDLLARRHLVLAETAERHGLADPFFMHTHWMGALGAANAGLEHAGQKAEHRSWIMTTLERVFRYGRSAAIAATTSFAFDRAAGVLKGLTGLLRHLAIRPASARSGDVSGPRVPSLDDLGTADLAPIVSGTFGSEVDLLVMLADNLLNAGRGIEAARFFEQASALAADEPQRRRLELRAAEQYLFAGAFGEGEATIRRVLGRVGLKVAQSVPGAMASFMWETLRMKVRGKSFVPRPQAEVDPNALALVDTLWSGTIGLSMAWPLGSQAFQQRHLRNALEAGEPVRVARALSIELAFSGLPGGNDDSKSTALSKLAHEVASTIDHPYPEAFATMSDAATHRLRGRWAAARAGVEKALEVYRRDCTGVTWEKDTAEFVSLSALAHMGALDLLPKRLEDALADAVERGDLYLEIQLRTRFSPLVDLMRDRPAQAREGIDKALARWTSSGFQIVHYWAYLNRIQAWLYEGRHDRALMELEAGRAPLKKSFMLMGQYYRIQFHEMVVRVMLAALGAGAGGSSLLKQARHSARKLASERMGWSIPMADLATALLSGLEGQRRAPSERLALVLRAVDGFEAADMRLHAQSARVFEARMAGDPEREARVHAQLTALGVAVPERFAAMLVPLPSEKATGTA